jgi:teichuronic acid biosynthesis glycosyltransferase TuaH
VITTRPIADVLILATADWDAPLWTNKQYVAREIGVHHRVLYVNSVGLRRPHFSLVDARRILSRLTGGGKTGASPPPRSVDVANPRLIPLHGRAIIDKVNRLSMSAQFKQWRQSDVPVLWTYSPLTFGLERYACTTVYHCVDFLGAQKGTNTGLIHQSESSLVAIADLTIATSRRLTSHVEALGAKRSICLENVADTDLFGDWTTTESRESAVLFAGNLVDEKVDFRLLRMVADHTDIPLHLAGPIESSSKGNPDLKALLSHPDVVYHGVLGREDLAKLCQRVSVALIPYLLTDLTLGIYPMKTFEYLAAGLPVVSTRLPSLATVDGVVATDPDTFVGSIRNVLHTGMTRRLDLRQQAMTHSWEERGSELRSLLTQLIADGCT